jgi:hypothetical protein
MLTKKYDKNIMRKRRIKFTADSHQGKKKKKSEKTAEKKKKKKCEVSKREQTKQNASQA